MRNANKCLQTALIILIVATILFIFVNSMLPPSVSSEESSAVAGIVGRLIPPNTVVGHFIQEHIRKIAHFAEYGILGVEIAIYVVLYAKNRARSALLNALTPFIVGFIDETIQIFSGRGPAISDVWIDVGGFAVFSVIVYLNYVIAAGFRKCQEHK